ncbi:MAG: chemotaxis protein CheW [Pseudomonadales bacterium]|nr:chemotaxis protein CheW [Pseudomonadales bacterium]
MSDIQQYIHIKCEAYALLINTNFVEEVVGVDEQQKNAEVFVWRERNLVCIDLCQILLGHANTQKRDYLIVKFKRSDQDENVYMAMAVSAVNDIEPLSEQDFSDIPQMDFPANDYFDKAYIHPESAQCVYRIRESALQGFAISEELL